MEEKRIDYCNAYEQIYTNGDLCLRSYNTIVLDYNAFDDSLSCTGLYSRTTIMHIGRYLRRNFNHNISYYDIKALFKLGKDWIIKHPFNDWYYYNTKTAETIAPFYARIRMKKLYR